MNDVFKFATVNFNNSDLTNLCVDSIRRLYPIAEIVVVNNSGIFDR